MVRIAGINIPQNKLVHIGLTYIYGQINSLTKYFLEIPRAKRVNELTDDEILKSESTLIRILKLKVI